MSLLTRTCGSLRIRLQFVRVVTVLHAHDLSLRACHNHLISELSKRGLTVEVSRRLPAASHFSIVIVLYSYDVPNLSNTSSLGQFFRRFTHIIYVITRCQILFRRWNLFYACSGRWDLRISMAFRSCFRNEVLQRRSGQQKQGKVGIITIYLFY